MRLSSKTIAIGLLLASASEALSKVRSSDPQAYLDEAIGILEDRHINRRTVDWRTLKREARSRVRNANAIEDVYPVIEYVIGELGERHTRFYPSPNRSPAALDKLIARRRTVFKMPEPTGELVNDRYGYIRIPAFGAPADHPDADLFTAISRRILLNHDRADICGWIIDVRGNTGGNIWPMLDGLLPVLAPRVGEGTIGGFDIDGRVSPVTVNGGRLVGEGIPDRPIFETRRAGKAKAPIAILVDSKTASSGEGVAYAFKDLPQVRYFGEVSAGLVTVNNPVTLSDGASLLLTVGYSLDRAGARIMGPIQPDVKTSGEAAKEAAVAWLDEQACPVKPSLQTAGATAPDNPTPPNQARPEKELSVVLDRSEADAALAVIDAFNAGRHPSAAELQRLYSSRPYLRLRERENSVKRPFTDEDFIAHLRSPEVRSASSGLRAALGQWDDETIQAAAARAQAYLPGGSRLNVTIFPMIKIKPNTFVFDLKKDPSIFYAIDPKESKASFANTLAHEMHHIGIGQNCVSTKTSATPALKILRRWIGAFNEGLAMLAAAGGPDVHPHADSSADEQAVWDREAAKFRKHLRQQDTYFRSVVAGEAGTEEEINETMRAYFGEQGPWYTVGWGMAVTIEKAFGREAVIDAFCHSETLLETYNEAALTQREGIDHDLPLWDTKLVQDLSR